MIRLKSFFQQTGLGVDWNFASYGTSKCRRFPSRGTLVELGMKRRLVSENGRLIINRNIVQVNQAPG